jgi:hypothetical protein
MVAALSLSSANALRETIVPEPSASAISQTAGDGVLRWILPVSLPVTSTESSAAQSSA